MASRDEIYAKFGVSAEAAQLFETDLGTILLGLEGSKHRWHLSPDPITAANFMEKLDRKTLGQVLDAVQKMITLAPTVVDVFQSGLSARNALNHGFYARHNFAIQTQEGRQQMLDDLEALHQQLFHAWQVAQQVRDALISSISEALTEAQKL